MPPNPLALVAEVTHRCPLHCVYCSNPLKLVAVKQELSTQEWIRDPSLKQFHGHRVAQHVRRHFLPKQILAKVRSSNGKNSGRYKPLDSISAFLNGL